MTKNEGDGVFSTGSSKILQYIKEVQSGTRTLDSFKGEIPDSWIEKIQAGLVDEAIGNEEAPVLTLLPVEAIPSKYQGMPAVLLEEIWTDKIYLDPMVDAEKRLQRKKAIEALRQQEINEGKGIFTETEEEIYMMVPTQYRNFDVETLNEMWVEPTYIDESKNKAFDTKKTLVLAFLRNKENARKRKEKAFSQGIEDKRKIGLIRESQGRAREGDTIEILERTCSSRELSNDSIHTFGSFETDGEEIAFLNNDHGQDAFAKYNDTYVVSDGASSYGKAGTMSKLLAEMVAKGVSQTSITEIFTKESFQNIIDDIQISDAYTKESSVHSTNISAENQQAGLATILAVKLNKEEKTISYASIGDSPLFIIDTDEAGAIVSFEIVNEDERITNENYADKEHREDMANPQTHLVGLRGNGNTTLSSMDAMKQGTVEYKKGRKIVLASDAFIKMLISSPESIDDMADNKPSLAKSYESIRDKYEVDHAVLWIENPANGRKMLNPLFFVNLSKDELVKTLSGWKTDNFRAADDMTMIAIDLDKQFA